MKYGTIALTVLVSWFASSLHAEDGSPSAAKMSRLGLGSMHLASDEQGTQVRGRFFYRVSFFNSIAQGATTDSNVFQQGTPLAIGPSPTLPIEHFSNLGPYLIADVSVSPPGPRVRTGSSNWSFSISNTGSIVVPSNGLPPFIMP